MFNVGASAQSSHAGRLPERTFAAHSTARPARSALVDLEHVTEAKCLLEDPEFQWLLRTGLLSPLLCVPLSSSSI